MFTRAPLPPASSAHTSGVGGAGAWDAGSPSSFLQKRDEKRAAARNVKSIPMIRIIKTPSQPAPLLESAVYDTYHNFTHENPETLAAQGFPGDSSPERYVTVTRTETAKSCQKTPLDLSCPIGLYVFCDWLTIYQDHPAGSLPVINDGYVVRFEANAVAPAIDQSTGELRPMFDATKAEYTVSRRMEHEGSFDTSLSIRCDGTRVELSGNVGRFGRPDNLFGLPVLETVARANDILETLNLPPFTCVQRSGMFARSDSFMKTNAQITRTDLTANFSTGSRDNAFRVLHWMGGQGTSRNNGKSPTNYGNGITWNEGSKRHYEKLYFKGDELGPHVSPEVREYCEQNGILRYEVSLKARELADRGLQSLTGWAGVTEEGTRMENVVYGKFAEVLTRNTVTATDLQDIPGKLGLIARSYLNGENPYETQQVAERTKRLWRKQLLEHGIDIARPCDVMRLTTRIRVIDLQPVAAPSWYSTRAA